MDCQLTVLSDDLPPAVKALRDGWQATFTSAAVVVSVTLVMEYTLGIVLTLAVRFARRCRQSVVRLFQGRRQLSRWNQQRQSEHHGQLVLCLNASQHWSDSQRLDYHRRLGRDALARCDTS